MQDHLPPLVEKHGEKLEIASIELSNPANYEIYLAAIELFNVPPVRQGVPALYIGDTHLIGADEIAQQLDGLIERYRKQGGVAYPAIAGFDVSTD